MPLKYAKILYPVSDHVRKKDVILLCVLNIDCSHVLTAQTFHMCRYGNAN